MDLKSLGKTVPAPLTGANASLLEAMPNPMEEYSTTSNVVTIRGEEFTSLCPATYQPDFGQIIVEYTPNLLIVESKSLKLYLGSFRNEPIFHEKVVAKICEDLGRLLDPVDLTVTGNFKSRGGWAISVASQYTPD